MKFSLLPGQKLCPTAELTDTIEKALASHVEKHPETQLFDLLESLTINALLELYAAVPPGQQEEALEMFTGNIVVYWQKILVFKALQNIG